MAPYLGLRGQKLAIARIVMVVLPSFLLFGYNQSQIGGVLGFNSGTVVAIYTIGCLFGALLCTATGNKLGRRKTLAIFAIVATVGQVIQSSSFSLGQLIVGRIVSGLGVGGVNAIVPVWQSECSKPKSRGKNVVILGMFIATGQAMAAWVNYGLGVIPEQQVAWRLPLAMPIIFTSMLLTGVFCFPESPRWLVQRNQLEKARIVTSILEDIPLDSEVLEVELSAMQASCEVEAQTKRAWIHIVRNESDRLLYRAFLAVAVNFAAQMTGANAISYYATTIFKQSLGYSPREAAVLAASLLSWKICSSSISIFTVDRFGRKPLFMTAAAGMSVAMTCLAVSVSFISHPAAGKAATFFLFFYMAFFPVGFLGANFLFAAEIAPQDLRVHFSVIGTATHWLFNFVIAEITPVCFTEIGYRTYIIYAVISASIVPLVCLTFPESNGRSLEEMNHIFSSPEHWWSVPSAERRTPQGIMAQIEDDHDENLARDKKGGQHIEKVDDFIGP